MAEVDKCNIGRYFCYLIYLGVYKIFVYFFYFKERIVKYGYNKYVFKEFSFIVKFMFMMIFLFSLKMYYIMKKINIVDKEIEYYVKSFIYV